MKKSTIIIVALIAAALGCWYYFNNPDSFAKTQLIQNDEASNIYFFYQEGCSHCDDAEKWITENHPDLKMNMINIRKGNGTNELIKFAGHHSINLNNLGTPLISMDDNYIMGWSPQNGALFNRYLRKLNAKNKATQTAPTNGSPK